MYNNVPDQFIPENGIPETIYANSNIDYVYNTDELNAGYEILERGVDENGWSNRVAIRSTGDEDKLTYEDLYSKVNKFAAGLRDVGVSPGDRVLRRTGETPRTHISHLAVWKIGGINVPIPTTDRAQEIEYYANDVEANTIITSCEGLKEVEKALENTPTIDNVVVIGEKNGDYYSFGEVIENNHQSNLDYASTSPLDVASIYYTGGTTGKPKGCIHSHASEVATVDIKGTEGRDIQKKDVLFCHGNVGHAWGDVEKITLPLRFGARTILIDQPGPEEMLDILDRYAVTVSVAATPMIRMILDSDKDLSNIDLTSLRLLIAGGDKLQKSTYEEWKEIFDIQLYNAVGMTQTRSYFLTSYRNGEKIAPGVSVGKPYDGYEAKLVDRNDYSKEVKRNEIGRLAIRGPTVAPYWNNIHPEMPEKMEQDSLDGWLLTDDTYYRDEEGYLYFEARIDDMITTSGYQVSSYEVEDILMKHYAIQEVAVVGIPDDIRGEIVKSFIVLGEDIKGTNDLKQEIQQFAKSEMSVYKYPREIEFIDELPKSTGGSIQRSKLLEQE